MSEETDDIDVAQAEADLAANIPEGESWQRPMAFAQLYALLAIARRLDAITEALERRGNGHADVAVLHEVPPKP